jgi:hypothetical protein
MSMTLYLDSFGGLDKKGLYSPAGFTPWDTHQTDAADVRRDQVLDKPYISFGKLSIADKLAFAAASLLFAHYPECRDPSTGIVLGTVHGSLSTDLRYQESLISGFPSPAIFSATLPSSAVSDVAIYYGLKGPNRVLCGEDSTIDAFDFGIGMLAHGKADTVVVLAINALEASDRSSPLAFAADRDNSAFAFLLTTRKKGPGLNLKFGFSFSGTAPTPEKPDVYLNDLVRHLLERKPGEIPFVSHHSQGSFLLAKDQ